MTATHSCNDARSIVQKKNDVKSSLLFALFFLGPWPFLLTSLSNNDNTSTAQWLPHTVCNDARSIVQKKNDVKSSLLFALFFLVPDLSFWPCLTMTIVAQPNDCHSCNDARSIVQKQKKAVDRLQDVFMTSEPRARTIWAAKKEPTSVGESRK